MNERIKELTGKALDQAMPQTWYGISPDDLDRIAAKLAELIVRECVQVAIEQKQWVKDQQPTFNYDDDRWDRARIQQSERIIEKIQEHFGVEG